MNTKDLTEVCKNARDRIAALESEFDTLSDCGIIPDQLRALIREYGQANATFGASLSDLAERGRSEPTARL